MEWEIIKNFAVFSADELEGWTFMVSTSSSSWEFIALSSFSLQHFILMLFFSVHFLMISPPLPLLDAVPMVSRFRSHIKSALVRDYTVVSGGFRRRLRSYGVTMGEEICDNWKHFFPHPHLMGIQFDLIFQCDSLITDAERSYRSDCETDDGISLANDNEFINGSSSQQLTTASRMKNRSPLGSKRGGGNSGPPGQPSSPFPNEMTNRRMQNAHERLRNGECEVHKIQYNTEQLQPGRREWTNLNFANLMAQGGKERASVGCAREFSSQVKSFSIFLDCLEQWLCSTVAEIVSEEERRVDSSEKLFPLSSFFLLLFFFSRVNGFMNFMLLLSSCLPLSRWNSNSVAVDTLNWGRRRCEKLKLSCAATLSYLSFFIFISLLFCV